MGEQEQEQNPDSEWQEWGKGKKGGKKGKIPPPSHCKELDCLIFSSTRQVHDKINKHEEENRS